MADYCYGEMSARACVQVFDVEVHSTSGESDDDPGTGIYEEDVLCTSSESEDDSDFDDRDESPPCPPFTPESPRDGEDLVDDVASLLDGKGIGNVLGGEAALSIMGVPLIPHFTAFIIPDEQIDQAAQVLRDAQYPRLQGFGPMLVSGLIMPLAGPLPPEDPFYMATSDARLYRPSLWGGRVMPNCRGRRNKKSYPVKILHPARYMENLVYLMVRDIGYLVCNGWQAELKCMLSFSPLLPSANLALAAIDVELEDVQDGPIRDWLGLHQIWDNNEAAICVRFAALHRHWKKSGLLGEPLMTPREAKGVSPRDIEKCLRNMEEGKPPSVALEESGWTCQLM
ncbi:uncharacterized protein BO72DRAFT_492077 [Aspergillus fijiensis CBS 313.89]|uniref:Uncharacterized protein n=1 Tax=Aspergillus fijiensis CBS 313.89 TaxID=1448319 RepID=A0A8G1S0R3_9EURO|nr:uncharacterized protein BO72DRAFT_492077 [Aspergillus fijiensis CBS 313.89]RAK81848.1 hypothetical protein BO72DRAFT_492077 [Aspergillus fijiensis CBS 313.89]